MGIGETLINGNSLKHTFLGASAAGGLICYAQAAMCSPSRDVPVHRINPFIVICPSYI